MAGQTFVQLARDGIAYGNYAILEGKGRRFS